MSRTLFLLGLLVAVVFAQIDIGGGGLIGGSTCTIVSAGLWSDASIWLNGLLPGLLGGVSVVVNSDIDVSVDASANCDTLTYSSARLDVQDSNRFSVGTLYWQGSGNFSLKGSSELAISQCSVSSSNVPSPHITGPGRVTVSSAATLQSNARLFLESCSVNGGNYNVNSGSQLYLQSAKVSGKTTVSGAGECRHEGSVSVSSNYNVNANSYHAPSSELDVNSNYGAHAVASGYRCHLDSAKLTVRDNAKSSFYENAEIYHAGSARTEIGANGNAAAVEITGGKCTKASASSGAHVSVGADTGSSSYLRFKSSSSGASSYIKGGGQIEIKNTGNVEVQEGANTIVDTDTEFKSYGSGKCTVAGRTEHQGYSKFNGRVDVRENGEVACSGSAGRVHVHEGGSLEFTGGKCTQVTTSNSNAHVTVGADTGNNAYLRVHASNTPTYIQGGQVEVKNTGRVYVEAASRCIANADTEIKGYGAHEVHVNGALHAIANLKHSCNTVGHEGAEIAAYGTGQHVVSAGNTVHSYGCALNHYNVQSDVNSRTKSTYSVGAASGAQAELFIRKSASGAASTCDNSHIELHNTGRLHVEEGAQLVVRSASRVSSSLSGQGTGRCNLEGTLKTEAPYTCETPTDVGSNGHLNLNLAHAHTLNSVTHQATSQTTVRAGPNGFTPCKVVGNANVNGKLNVDLGSYQPTQKVDLFQCGKLNGKFSSVAVTGAAAQTGTIVYEPNKVCYQPYSLAPAEAIDSGSASLTPAPVALFGLALFAAWLAH